MKKYTDEKKKETIIKYIKGEINREEAKEIIASKDPTFYSIIQGFLIACPEYRNIYETRNTVSIRYPLEFKLKVVEDLLKTNSSFSSINRKYKIKFKTVERWYFKYKDNFPQYNYIPFESESYLYPLSFKKEVVKYICDNKSTIKNAAIKFKISKATCYKWYHKYKHEFISDNDDKEWEEFVNVVLKK